MFDLTKVDTKRELAKISGLSHDTISRVESIEQKASEETKEKAERFMFFVHMATGEIRIRD